MVTDNAKQHLLNYTNLLADDVFTPSDWINNIVMLPNSNWWQQLFTHYELYQKILNIHGDVWVCGVRWGPQMVLYTQLRQLFEPHNMFRRVTGFDTFTGFTGKDLLPSEADKEKGMFAVGEDWVQTLSGLIQAATPVTFNGDYRYDLIVGDAADTVPKYLQDNLQTQIAMVYMDFDLYAPTLDTLNHIYPRLTKGSLILFDQINYKKWPGEAQAFRDWCRGHKELQRTPYSNSMSYVQL
jgi:hypothetical protein